jgi:hypothetical protein
MIWLWLVAGLVLYIGGLWWLFSHRQWNRKARVRRRLLVEENGQPVWRTVRARYLVGWPDSDGALASGMYIPNENRDRRIPRSLTATSGPYFKPNAAIWSLTRSPESATSTRSA